jgi:hypothetical protein
VPFSAINHLETYVIQGSVFSKASKSLGFVWVSMNDLSAHTDAFWGGDSKNADFAAAYANKAVASVQKLLAASAPAVGK